MTEHVNVAHLLEVLCVGVVLILTAFNLKLYTEILKDRNAEMRRKKNG